MTCPSVLKLASLAVLTCVANVAQAGRPFATEDAGILARSDCEWESFAARVRTRDEPTTTGWNTQLGCGVGFKTQLAVAHGRSKTDSDRSREVMLSGKTGVVSGGDEGTSLTVAYGVVAAKSGDEASYHGSTTALNLVLTRPLAKDWTMHANLGWSQARQSKQNTTTWAVLAEWAVSEPLALGAEVYGNDRDKPWLGTGVRWTLSEAWSVNASYAVNQEKPHAHAATAGFKLVF